MLTQAEKGAAFRALHEREGAFIIPNPWDVGTARIMAHLGFEALASTSAGYAFSLGLQDNRVGRDRMMRHVAELSAATDLPVSADLENGFGDDPETVAETIRQAAAAGLAGCSIEDSTGRADDPIYAFEHAVDRIRAAAEVARSLPFTFTLTSRAENFLVGRDDIADTIRRLQAYQEAGADVLYAPGLSDRADLAAVISSVDRPVNALAGFGLNFNELSELGVKRVSVGGSLTRAAYGAVIRAGREMLDHGTFNFSDDAVPFRELSNMFPD
ncbi:MAG: isocitrate lyase/phosphoenolpyruvate mutase family protein [Pyrinomonadaceae bacterium]